MKKTDFTNKYSSTHHGRFQKTLDFMEGLITTSDRILDIGPINPLAKAMMENGYEVQNTPENIDLDFNYDIVKEDNYDVVTAFEIFEHLVSPFPLLHSIKANKLIASVPLKLWFANAYWNENDPYDRHYHEFEPKQFDMLLNKAGWEIKKSEKWIGARSNKLGFRTILRRFTPRYYIVYCERINPKADS